MEANRKETDISVTIEPRVAVIGLGGAGCNVVSGFYNALAPVDTIAINTDRKALDETAADKKIYICKAVTKGEGTRGDARLGNKCAKIHEDEIEKAIVGHDVVFLITGLGGGTGTGATSVVAEICNRNNMMTFTITINPFFFETDRI
ncbi:MAG: cell division protein FtsZ, partial [Candidatus Methanoplasma sp.]|nr:cell division protein FtsZ [Candidatus Methanoplasma sp.]